MTTTNSGSVADFATITLEAIILAGRREYGASLYSEGHIDFLRCTQNQLRMLEALVNIAQTAPETKEAELARRVVEEYTNYLLFGKHKVAGQRHYSKWSDYALNFSDEVQWPLNHEDIWSSIGLLKGVGKGADDIAQRVGSALQGGKGSGGMLRNYLHAVQPNMQRIRENHAEVYRALWALLPQTITPEAITGAIEEVRKYEAGMLVSGEYYGTISGLHGRLKSGDLKRELESRCPLQSRRYSGGGEFRLQKVEEIGQTVDELVKEVENKLKSRELDYAAVVEQNFTAPIIGVLQEFEKELGAEAFKQAGYDAAWASIKAFETGVRKMQAEILEGVRKAGEEVKESRKYEINAIRKQAGILAPRIFGRR